MFFREGGDDFTAAGHAAADFFKAGHGEGLHAAVSRRPAHGIELDAFNVPEFRGLRGQGSDVLLRVVESLRQQNFQPYPAAVHIAEAGEAFKDNVKRHVSGRAVDAFGRGGQGRVHGRAHDVGQGEIFDDVRHPEQGGVGEHGHGHVGHLLDAVDHIPELFVECGFAGTREADDVGFVRSEEALQFGEDVGTGHPAAAFCGVHRGVPELTVDTVIGTGLERNNVDAERASEAPRGHRSVNILVRLHEDLLRAAFPPAVRHSSTK